MILKIIYYYICLYNYPKRSVSNHEKAQILNSLGRNPSERDIEAIA